MHFVLSYLCGFHVSLSFLARSRNFRRLLSILKTGLVWIRKVINDSEKIILSQSLPVNVFLDIQDSEVLNRTNVQNKWERTKSLTSYLFSKVVIVCLLIVLRLKNNLQLLNSSIKIVIKIIVLYWTIINKERSCFACSLSWFVSPAPFSCTTNASPQERSHEHYSEWYILLQT